MLPEKTAQTLPTYLSGTPTAKKMKRLTLSVLALPFLLSGCGFHRHGVHHSQAIKSVILDTSDPYGPYARSVRKELRMNGIVVSDDDNPEAATINLVSNTVSSDTASIFINGSTAEYQMMMDSRIRISTPGCMPEIFSVKAYKSYFSYSSTALAVDAAKETYTEEMYTHTAESIIRKLYEYDHRIKDCVRPGN